MGQLAGDALYCRMISNDDARERMRLWFVDDLIMRLLTDNLPS
jgi:hypothetical protein